MLKLRPEHYQTLAAEELRRYQTRLMQHLRKTFPLQTGVADNDTLTTFMNLAIAQAGKLGINTEASVQSFADHMLLLGIDFHNDPLLQDICVPLRDPDLVSPIQRLDELYELAWNYLDGVRGPEAIDQIQAATRLRSRLGNREARWGDTSGELLESLQRLYPAKAIAHPQAVLKAFCEEALKRAGQDGFTQAAARSLYVYAAWVAGIGFFHDPLVLASAATQVKALADETEPSRRTELLWKSVALCLNQLLERVQQASSKDGE